MIPKFRAWLKNEEVMYYLKGFRELDDNKSIELFADNITITQPIDNIILMQSTERYDNHDKEIFEGDILILDEDKENLGVIIKELNFEIELPGVYEHYSELFDITNMYDKKEVIGNIYQNPKILEDW